MNTPPPVNTDDPAHASGLLATIREALRGSHLDYTTAPVGRAVIMLAVPMVMEMAMESIFAVADVFLLRPHRDEGRECAVVFGEEIGRAHV